MIPVYLVYTFALISEAEWVYAVCIGRFAFQSGHTILETSACYLKNYAYMVSNSIFFLLPAVVFAGLLIVQFWILSMQLLLKRNIKYRAVDIFNNTYSKFKRLKKEKQTAIIFIFIILFYLQINRSGSCYQKSFSDVCNVDNRLIIDLLLIVIGIVAAYATSRRGLLARIIALATIILIHNYYGIILFIFLLFFAFYGFWLMGLTLLTAIVFMLTPMRHKLKFKESFAALGQGAKVFIYVSVLVVVCFTVVYLLSKIELNIR